MFVNVSTLHGNNLAQCLKRVFNNDVEICERWHRLFNGNDLSSRYLKGEALTSTEEQRLNEFIELWGDRLVGISWFTRCLNDKIIRNDFEQLCWP